MKASLTVESAWKSTLQQADKSRVRKAKQDARAGAVSRVQMQEGGMSAMVKASGPERGVFQVFLPLLADYTSHGSQVAAWLARRPDWIAAHFAGEWERPFAQFIEENGLNVFPDDHAYARLQCESKCTCSDWQPLCPHALAFLYHLIWEAESHPLAVFRFVGLDEEQLLNEAHQIGVGWIRQQELTSSDGEIGIGQSASQESVQSNIAQLLLEVQEGEPSGRLIPHFRSDRHD